MANPAFSEKTFEKVEYVMDQPMTLQGTLNKVTLLLLVTVGVAGVTFVSALSGQSWVIPLGLGGAFGGLGIAIALAFKPVWAPTLAPVYAVLEGAFVGVISSVFTEFAFPAAVLTFGVLALMLVVYRSGLIRVTQGFVRGVVAATGAVALLYLLTFALSFFNIQMPYIHDSGPIGIIFSLVVVGLAAMNLLLDFHLIEQGVAQRAPRYMEWYAAFGLLVTIVWLYLEILKLLAKLNRR
ncbi:MAG: Bax inhibitor-1/YccA family protein [Sphingobacteriaceae bacterium]|nr:Bax inhibitor-1/YccA family protein [Cytophagaceae bacterium]